MSKKHISERCFLLVILLSNFLFNSSTYIWALKVKVKKSHNLFFSFSTYIYSILNHKHNYNIFISFFSLLPSFNKTNGNYQGFFYTFWLLLHVCNTFNLRKNIYTFQKMVLFTNICLSLDVFVGFLYYIGAKQMFCSKILDFIMFEYM